MSTVDKTTKSSKGSKKRDYGTPVKPHDLPAGWEKAIQVNKYFKFTKFGQSIEGIFAGIIPSEKKRYSDSILLLSAEGQETKVAGNAQVLSTFSDNRIPLGSAVRITFTSAIEISGGRTMKEFDIAFNKAKADANCKQLGISASGKTTKK